MFVFMVNIKKIVNIQCQSLECLKWLISLYFAFLSRQSSVGSRQSEDKTIYTFQSRFIGNVIK